MPNAVIKKIANASGVYCIEYEGSSYCDFALFESLPASSACEIRYLYTAFGCNVDTQYSLGFCLDILRSEYRRSHPNEPLYDPPITIVTSPENRPEKYRIVMLACGLFVAHSQHFIAAIDCGSRSWFLRWVAKDAGEFFAVRLPPGKKVAVTLEWDGEGISRAKSFLEAHARHANPTASYSLLPRRLPEENNNVDSLWVGGLSGDVYCTSGDHTYRLVHEGTWTWRVFACETERILSDCHLEGLEMELLGSSPWQILVKDQEQENDPTGYSDDCDEDLEGLDYDYSFCDLFGF